MSIKPPNIASMLNAKYPLKPIQNPIYLDIISNTNATKAILTIFVEPTCCPYHKIKMINPIKTRLLAIHKNHKLVGSPPDASRNP